MIVVCPLCVQWRCVVCKSHEWPTCCDYATDSEPYWPDGTTAELTQQTYCDRCAQSLVDYEAAHAGDGHA